MTKHPKNQILLDDGGMLYINKAGSHWSIDVFAFDSQKTDEPIYHAFYNTEQEARDDAAMWKTWPEMKL
jgi:hypothetical protein